MSNHWMGLADLPRFVFKSESWVWGGYWASAGTVVAACWLESQAEQIGLERLAKATGSELVEMTHIEVELEQNQELWLFVQSPSDLNEQANHYEAYQVLEKRIHFFPSCHGVWAGPQTRQEFWQYYKKLFPPCSH